MRVMHGGAVNLRPRMFAQLVNLGAMTVFATWGCGGNYIDANRLVIVDEPGYVPLDREVFL